MNVFDLSRFTDDQFAAYLAGFTDGEGYIGLEPMRNSGHCTIRIVLANCVRETLDGIRARLGFGAIRSQQQKAHWRERFTLSFYNMRDCEIALKMMLPFLTIKHAVATEALSRINDAKAAFADRNERNRKIVERANRGDILQQDVAKMFGVSVQLVSRLLKGHKWPSVLKHIASTRRRGPDGLFLPVCKSSPR